MRCPDCNKFVGFEQAEPELEVALDGKTISGSVRLVLLCAECSQELMDAELDVDIDVDHSCEKGKDKEPDLELDGESADNTDRYEDKDRHGRPIKSMRYQKHFYGADLTFDVTCNHCGETFTVEDSVEEQASGFNELV